MQDQLKNVCVIHTQWNNTITGKPNGAAGEDRWEYREGTSLEQMTGGELIRTAHGRELNCLGKLLPLVRGRVAVRCWDELGVRAERVVLVSREPRRVTTSDPPSFAPSRHFQMHSWTGQRKWVWRPWRGDSSSSRDLWSACLVHSHLGRSR
jgi:hypothetical protein